METVNHNENNVALADNDNNDVDVAAAAVVAAATAVAAANVFSPESVNSTPIEQCLNINDHSENFTNVIDNQFETNKVNLENISDSTNLTTATMKPISEDNNLPMDFAIPNSAVSNVEPPEQPIASIKPEQAEILPEIPNDYYQQQATMNDDFCFDNTINTAYPAADNMDNLMMSMLNHSQFCNQNGSIAADHLKPNDNQVFKFVFFPTVF